MIGQRVRVVLVAVCCDHPALCKVCGFGDHNKEEGFCPHCHISHKDLYMSAGMQDCEIFHTTPFMMTLKLNKII